MLGNDDNNEKLYRAFSSLFRNRMNVFYVLAFLPLLLVAYSYIEWPFSAVIPVYGFILLLIKENDLSLRHKAGSFQRALGLLVATSSFFVSYASVPFLESSAFYGGANYAVYILGLFLIFFESSALREAFTPVFLIVAGVSSSLVSHWLEHYFAGYIPYFLSLIVAILRLLGVEAVAHPPDAIVLQTVRGPLALGFAWGCVGVSSMLIFLIVLVITLFEEPASLRTKLLWGAMGAFGVFVMNVVRLIIIFLAGCFYGSDVGAKLHYFIGYVLFILWLLIFFYAFSKRRRLSEKISPVWSKLLARRF